MMVVIADSGAIFHDNPVLGIDTVVVLEMGLCPYLADVLAATARVLKSRI